MSGGDFESASAEKLVAILEVTSVGWRSAQATIPANRRSVLDCKNKTTNSNLPLEMNVTNRHAVSLGGAEETFMATREKCFWLYENDRVFGQERKEMCHHEEYSRRLNKLVSQ